MPDQEDAENYTSHTRHQGHVTCHLNGRFPAPINSVDSEKPNIDVEQDSGLPNGSTLIVLNATIKADLPRD
jgi:hypothetical protein